MTANKRERSINFAKEETDLLFYLIAKNVATVENKKCDAATWTLKENCWKSIEAEFNSKSGTIYRTRKTLKLKWEGAKKTVRSKMASLADNTTTQPLTPAEEKVKVLISLSQYDNTPPAIIFEDILPPPIPQIKEEKVKDLITLPFDGLDNGFDSDGVIPEPDVDFDIDSPNEDVMEYDLLPTSTQLKPTTAVKQDESKLIKDKPENSEVIIQNLMERKRKELEFKAQQDVSPSKQIKIFEQVAMSKLEIAKLQRNILQEQLAQLQQKRILEAQALDEQRKRWAFDEEERKYKREVWALEKKLILDKFEKNKNIFL